MIRLPTSTMAPPRLLETSGQMAMINTHGNSTASWFLRAELVPARRRRRELTPAHQNPSTAGQSRLKYCAALER